MEKEPRAHRIVEEWFEESESHIEDPSLVDDVDRGGAVRQAGLKRKKFVEKSLPLIKLNPPTYHND